MSTPCLKTWDLGPYSWVLRGFFVGPFSRRKIVFIQNCVLVFLIWQEQIVKIQEKSTFLSILVSSENPLFNVVGSPWRVDGREKTNTLICRENHSRCVIKKYIENPVLRLVSRGFRNVLHPSKQWKRSISWRFSGSNVHILGESVEKSVLTLSKKCTEDNRKVQGGKISGRPLIKTFLTLTVPRTSFSMCMWQTKRKMERGNNIQSTGKNTKNTKGKVVG